jgi:hypothetical protein
MASALMLDGGSIASRLRYLKQVILNHVADDPGLLIKLTAALDAERLGHRDLHVFNELSIPERLEQRIGEAEEQDVLDGFLAEVVIDAEDLRLRQVFVQRRVELARRLQIAPERLFDDDARIGEAIDPARCLTTTGKHARGIAK